jgi:Lar family restriction alleviation protein
MWETITKIDHCPFCGNYKMNRTICVEAIGIWVVECDRCTCQGPWATTEDEAIELWNKRSYNEPS